MQERGLTGDWYEYGRLHRILVQKSKPWNGRPVIQLSIRRHDNKPIDLPWRDKQAIKNQLVGEKYEGVELYPAESRRQETKSNQYHLWVIADDKFRFTDWIGWKADRNVATDPDPIDHGELVGDEDDE